MDAKEAGRELLSRTCEFLISLPFDVKALQEAVADPDLDQGARELAAGVVHHVLVHQDRANYERMLDSVFLVRLGFHSVRERGGDNAATFASRFTDVYERLDDDLACFRAALGEDLWAWLGARLGVASRLPYKGRRVAEYVADGGDSGEGALDQLYEACIEFQTNYSVSEQQVRNKLRRPEQIVEILQRRHAEDSKKRP